MTPPPQPDDLSVHAGARFRAMVESVGVKRFAADLGLSTRQINRMLSGAQPNPVERLIRSLQCCEPDVGDDVLGFVCQEAGGHFVKEVGALDEASSNAVKECAEAIAAISDGEITSVGEQEIREAISALIALLRTVQASRSDPEAARWPLIHTRPAVTPSSPTSAG